MSQNRQKANKSSWVTAPVVATWRTAYFAGILTYCIATWTVTILTDLYLITGLTVIRLGPRKTIDRLSLLTCLTAAGFLAGLYMLNKSHESDANMSLIIGGATAAFMVAAWVRCLQRVTTAKNWATQAPLDLHLPDHEHLERMATDRTRQPETEETAREEALYIAIEEYTGYNRLVSQLPSNRPGSREADEIIANRILDEVGKEYPGLKPLTEERRPR